jgi:hypothetical protein
MKSLHILAGNPTVKSNLTMELGMQFSILLFDG